MRFLNLVLVTAIFLSVLFITDLLLRLTGFLAQYLYKYYNYNPNLDPTTTATYLIVGVVVALAIYILLRYIPDIIESSER